jgi:predicted transcriptional regulator
MNPDNLGRMRAKELISLLPGVHLRKLSRLLGVSLNTAHYHVSNLEKDQEIFCSKEGEFLRAYPISIEREKEVRLYAVLQRRTARTILKKLIETNGEGRGMTNGQLSAMTRLSQSTVSEHVSLLRRLGVVRKVPLDGGRWGLVVDPGDLQRVSSIVYSMEKNFLTVTTERYLELWDF